MEPDHRYAVGEADFENADLPEAQQHVDYPLFCDKSLGLLEPGEDRVELIQIASVRAAALFQCILQFCWMSGGELRTCHAALVRFCALSMLVNPGLFGNMTYEQMGKRLRVTRQALSKIATEFQKETQVHFRRSRRAGSEESFRKAANRSWKKRKSQQ